MKKTILILSITGVLNLLMSFFLILEIGDENVNFINDILGRLITGIYLLVTAYYIHKESLLGWRMCAVFIWILASIAVISPFTIIHNDPLVSKDTLSIVMLFIGQWVGAALTLCVWFFWWKKKRTYFTKN